MITTALGLTKLTPLLMTIGLVANLTNTCPAAPAPIIKTELKILEAPRDVTLSSAQLTAQFAKDPDSTLATDGTEMVGGLTKSQVTAGYKANFTGIEDLRTLKTCQQIHSLTYTVTYSPVVYIASDYKNLGCRFSQTVAHEKRHLDTDARVLTNYMPTLKPLLTKIVTDVVARQVPYPYEKIEDIRRQMFAEIEAGLKPIINDLIEKRRTEQAKIDTVVNYARDQAICPGQTPQFDRK